MKRPIWLAPLAIMVIGGVWLLGQSYTIRQLEEANRSVKHELANFRNVEDAGSAAMKPRTTALDRRPVDWKKVSEELRDGVDIGGGLLTNQRLLAALDAMNVAELLAALDALPGAGLSSSELEALEKRLAFHLIAKDPEVGMTRFIGRADWGFTLDGPFAQWFERDPGQALDWVARQTAAGVPIPGRVISAPFFDQLKSSPQTAGALLAALPEEARLKSLGSTLRVREIRSGGQREWADVVRTHLPDADRLTAIAWPLANWSDGDGSPMSLDEVDAYLANIKPSPSELEACVMAAVLERSWQTREHQDPDPEVELSRLREWVSHTAPDLKGRATAAALISMMEVDGRKDDVVRLAADYHRQEPNEPMLIQLLDRFVEAGDNRGRALASQLADEEKRQTYLEKLSAP
jgi:hypothetical protein